MQGGHPVQYASPPLTETEKRYSQIKKEVLSVVFDLTRFHTYTYGRKVTVYNDHKPLAAVLKRTVGENPIRLQRMLCRIMGYDLDFMYIKGKDLLIADNLSRSHMTNHTRSQSEEEIETIGLVIQDQRILTILSEEANKHTKSSPHHHQSNGKAESAVKIAKGILRKTENSALNPYEALLDQHNTPTVDMTTSPAQRFLHRRLKYEIPMKATLLTPEIAETVLEEKAKKTAKFEMY
ncbi:uncharacterized protein [Montipora foliosa]|uniref:uncharacterized protein n=1 Tax=Montipora foliosa TaxID=591990 RepID=UPI0035F12314